MDAEGSHRQVAGGLAKSVIPSPSKTTIRLAAVVFGGFLIWSLGAGINSQAVHAETVDFPSHQNQDESLDGIDDYPAQWRNVPMNSTQDSWGYYNRNCTSFAAWRLSSRNGFPTPRGMGNASNWGAWAASQGYSVNMTPAIGSIAWFANHVAWVEAINGSTVTIEEYNQHLDGTYSRRDIAANSTRGYIHFRDIGGGGGINAQFLGMAQLSPGQVMWAGQYILSGNVQYALVMQTDGNLVLYGDGMRALWSSGTPGSGAHRVVMQYDGNLVIYRPNNTPAWASNTDGRGLSNFIMQDDGNAVVYTTNWQPTWSSGTAGHPSYNYIGSDRLNNGQIISQNQYFRSSDRRYAVLLEPNGNLVLYGPGYHVLWVSGTYGSGAFYLGMQDDGNLVLYRSNWVAVWATNTAGRGASFAVMQDDGNFVVYSYIYGVSWATYTNGRI